MSRSCWSFSGTDAAKVSPGVKGRRPYGLSLAIYAMPASFVVLRDVRRALFMLSNSVSRNILPRSVASPGRP